MCEGVVYLVSKAATWFIMFCPNISVSYDIMFMHIAICIVSNTLFF